MEKEILKKFGEDTAFSAKNHFKAASIRYISMYLFIIIPFVISIICLADLITNNTVNKILNCVSLISSVILLVYQATDGKNNHVNHKAVAENYLSLHNEIYTLYKKENISMDEVDKIKEKVNKVNKSDKPFVSWFAYYFAKKAIEKTGEMNRWWQK